MSARPPHVVLIGLMGAGKTTVGRIVAERMGRPFVDTDDVVAAQAGASVADVFATEGEAGFRARERAALTDVIASPEPLVVACGGGAMTDAENRRTVAGECVVWLRAGAATLADRATAEGLTLRPLLAGRDPRTVLRRLDAERAPSYEAVADVEVDTDGRPAVEVAAEVVAAYGVRA